MPEPPPSRVEVEVPAEIRKLWDERRDPIVRVPDEVLRKPAKRCGLTGSELRKLVDAMKGLAWVSPRGPMSIDPATRDVVQNIYIRRCEMVNGKLWNVEFDTIENVKDPG